MRDRDEFEKRFRDRHLPIGYEGKSQDLRNLRPLGSVGLLFDDKHWLNFTEFVGKSRYIGTAMPTALQVASSPLFVQAFCIRVVCRERSADVPEDKRVVLNTLGFYSSAQDGWNPNDYPPNLAKQFAEFLVLREQLKSCTFPQKKTKEFKWQAPYKHLLQWRRDFYNCALSEGFARLLDALGVFPKVEKADSLFDELTWPSFCSFIGATDYRGGDFPTDEQLESHPFYLKAFFIRLLAKYAQDTIPENKSEFLQARGFFERSAGEVEFRQRGLKAVLGLLQYREKTQSIHISRQRSPKTDQEKAQSSLAQAISQFRSQVKGRKPERFSNAEKMLLLLGVFDDLLVEGVQGLPFLRWAEDFQFGINENGWGLLRCFYQEIAEKILVSEADTPEANFIRQALPWVEKSIVYNQAFFGQLVKLHQGRIRALFLRTASKPITEDETILHQCGDQLQDIARLLTESVGAAGSVHQAVCAASSAAENVNPAVASGIQSWAKTLQKIEKKLQACWDELAVSPVNGKRPRPEEDADADGHVSPPPAQRLRIEDEQSKGADDSLIALLLEAIGNIQAAEAMSALGADVLDLVPPGQEGALSAAELAALQGVFAETATTTTTTTTTTTVAMPVHQQKP